MITTMLILFVVGYAFIAFEHKTGINKSAIALLMCGILWSIFSLEYPSALPGLTQTTVSDEILLLKWRAHGAKRSAQPRNTGPLKAARCEGAD